MPRLLNGSACHGVGATGGSIDNVLVIPGAGTLAWQWPTNVVCNAPGNFVGQFDPTMRTLSQWLSPGCDVVRAGHGTVAASLDGVGLWLRNRAGFMHLGGFTALDVDRTQGTALGYIKSWGQHIFIWFADYAGGATPVITTGPLDKSGARVLDNIVAWSELVGSTWVAKGYHLAENHPIDVATLPGNAYQPLILQWQNQLWVLYSDQNGEGHLHPIDQPNNQYHFNADAFGLDGELTRGQSDPLLVAWCSNAGESAGSLIKNVISA